MPSRFLILVIITTFPNSENSLWLCWHFSPRAILATMASGMVILALAVILRFYSRRLTMFPLKADDYLIIAAWVTHFSNNTTSSLMLIVKTFSTLLTITNIVGVIVGGFGVLFESLRERNATTSSRCVSTPVYQTLLLNNLYQSRYYSLYSSGTSLRLRLWSYPYFASTHVSSPLPDSLSIWESSSSSYSPG